MGEMTPSLEAFFVKVSRGEAMTPGRRDAIMQGIQYAADRRQSPMTRSAFNAFKAAVDALKKEVDSLAAVGGQDARELKICRRDLVNIGAFVSQMYWDANPAEAEREGVKSSDFREPFMADSLLLIARELYPDRKIITWGASAHLMHGSKGVEWEQRDGEFGPDPDGFVPMGDTVREALGDEVYTIAFIAYGGAVGRPWTGATRLPTAPVGSLEELCYRTGERFLFVDLRGPRMRGEPAWLTGPLIARPRGYVPMRAAWPTTCDAMIFTAWMYPSTKAIETEP
jgi:erythromycin esterase-like protein